MYRLPCVSAVFIRCVCFKKKTEHFSSGHITKTKALVKYGGEQWKPMLRVSSVGKADMELCLPVPLQRKRECADARGMFMLGAGRVCVCACVTWNILQAAVFAYVAPEWLRLMNKHTNGPDAGIPSVPPSFLTCRVMNDGFPPSTSFSL